MYHVYQLSPSLVTRCALLSSLLTHYFCTTSSTSIEIKNHPRVSLSLSVRMSMEDDEAMARRLQAEEDASAARVLTARQRQVDELETRFKQKLASGASFIARYERHGAENAARAVLPMAQLELEAEKKLGDAAPGDEKTKGG